MTATATFGGTEGLAAYQHAVTTSQASNIANAFMADPTATKITAEHVPSAALEKEIVGQFTNMVQERTHRPIELG